LTTLKIARDGKLQEVQVRPGRLGIQMGDVAAGGDRGDSVQMDRPAR
jgi:hypothetical protein